ncbi:MAG: hypothetical protein H8E44_24320 [Planctomycetes bacterium]|nr:hypothetical protein [Planctomycetota bacterium]MBL7042817.1 hypothetical protein [Pirellulaceae bacterium]
MSDQFDPYHKWLGIAPKDQPPHHYRLLGIDAFEDDRDVIDSAANRVMTYLKELATGDDAAHSQRIMNEVMQARICLLNPKRKTAYDAELRERLSAKQPPPPRVSRSSTTPQAPKAASPPSPVAIVATSPMPERHRGMNWLMLAVGSGVAVLAVLILIVVMFAMRDGQPDQMAVADGQSDAGAPAVAGSASDEEPKQIVPTDPLLSVKPFEKAPSPKEPKPDPSADSPPEDKTGEAGTDTSPTAEPGDPSKAESATDESTETEQTPVALPVVHSPEPVPSAEAQERARRSALESYRGEILGSTTSVKRGVLARRIWKAAADNSVEAPAKFVLLTEAYNLAIAAADVTLANEIMEAAKQDFTIDRLPASESALDAAATALEQLSGAAKTPADSAAVAEIGLALAGLAAADGRMETAKKMVSTALSAARKAEDDELIAKATLRLVELQ